MAYLAHRYLYLHLTLPFCIHRHHETVTCLISAGHVVILFTTVPYSPPHHQAVAVELCQRRGDRPGGAQHGRDALHVTGERMALVGQHQQLNFSRQN